MAVEQSYWQHLLTGRQGMWKLISGCNTAFRHMKYVTNETMFDGNLFILSPWYPASLCELNSFNRLKERF
jgi:hypothetical protein